MPSVHLKVSCDTTQFGEQVAVLGSWNNWDKSHPTTLHTSSSLFPYWTVDLQISSTSFEYKYAIVRHSNIVRWEPGPHGHNRKLKLSNSSIKIRDTYGQIPVPTQVSQNLKKPHIPFDRTDRVIDTSDAHRDGLDSLERAIVTLTAQRKSWRQRLAYVRELFTEKPVADEAGFERGNVHHLATIAVYLNFLATGQVRCDEDGGHHRPNHHAAEARRLEMALAEVTRKAMEEKGIGRFAPVVVRKIFPLLPSYSSQFTVSVPLTRIRDIAHRGDIPRDFKQEIKHQLQNKLHRCAGPEDLATSQRFLDRINQGGYSQGFSEQFRIFHEELRAFFNAATTDERLQYLVDNQNTKPVSSMAGKLLGLKHGKSPALEQMELLTNLRQGITELPMMKGLRSYSEELPDEDTQKTRLADIELEGYAFLLLAGIAKDVEQQQGSGHFEWSGPLFGLSMAIRNVALSGVCTAEAHATANELAFLKTQSCSTDLLRIKSAVDRASRLGGSFSSAISDVYMRRVSSLGNALHVDHHAISVFAEAEIRSNVMFQASRIADACRRVCRTHLKLPPWDPLFVGETEGKILFVEELKEVPIDQKDQVILVCRGADGDEDIPSMVRGVILGRPLPHLSHLGVRARQAGVVFVCAEDGDTFDAFWNRRRFSYGSLVVDGLKGLASFVESDPSSDPPSAAHSADDDEEIDSMGSLDIKFDAKLCAALPLKEVSRQTGSSKSEFAGKLLALAGSSDGLFQAPRGIALSHGVFQRQRVRNLKEYENRIEAFDKEFQASSSKQYEIADSLREFIETKFELEPEYCSAIQKMFEPGTKVMVRSSANAEDLEKMSGAGLYDSIANIVVHSTKDLQRAVLGVWGSLWTKRAASSRASYRVPHENVSMAVLIQEMVRADLSFVAFSYDPVLKDPDYVYIEVAIGMGETLASATSEGSPYRFRVNRKSHTVDTIAMASYSYALVPDKYGSGLVPRVIDYTDEQMTNNSNFRNGLVSRIATSVLHLEREFGAAQDIEGAVTLAKGSTNVFVVQARPQVL